MSALAHFADSSRTSREVREVPLAAVRTKFEFVINLKTAKALGLTVQSQQGGRLFDHLVGSYLQRYLRINESS
jgi:hypothetical protein